MVEYKNGTLSDLLNVVFDRFIPKLNKKYIELNVRNMSSYKGYNRSIPFYMHDRPKWIVDDMIEKLAKIQAEVKYAKIVKIQNNIQNNSGITSAGSKVNVKSTMPNLRYQKFISVDKRKGNLSSRFWLK